MKKEQFITVLNKITASVNNMPISEWPGSLTCECNHSFSSMTKIELATPRCTITMWTDYAIKKLCVRFKVNNNMIESFYPVPHYGLRWTSKVWRKWASLSKTIINKHKASEKIKSSKQMEEQIEVFNNLFYNSFPEEIDDILFNKNDD